MEYDITDIQGDTLLVQRHLYGSLDSIDKAAEERDSALSRGLDTKEKLRVAIQDVSNYVQKSGEALAAGQSLATNAGKAQNIIARAALGQDILPAAEHAAASSEHSILADQSRNEAIYHGNKAIFSLNAAANGLAAVITHSGKGIKAAENGLRLLGFGKDTLNEKIMATYGANDSVKGMGQKFETAIEKGGQYLLGLNMAKGHLVDASPSTAKENEYFDARHDVGDVRFLIERVVTGIGRLRESTHKRVGTFIQLLELVHTKVTEKDVQELNGLLGRLNETIEAITGTCGEQKELPELIKGTLDDSKTFLKSL